MTLAGMDIFWNHTFLSGNDQLIKLALSVKFLENVGGEGREGLTATLDLH